MKEIKKVVLALVAVAVCLGIGYFTGLSFNEFFGGMEFNFVSLLKVIAVVGVLVAVDSLLKLCCNSIRKESTFLTILKSLLDYITAILAVVWSLRILGADINGIIAGLGILGLVIGMSAQDIINDLVTGLFLLFEQEYKVGDIIEVNGFTGRVTEMGVRTTCITDNGGNEKIINNSAMKNILNRSSYRSSAVIDVAVPTDKLNKVLNADFGEIKCLGLEKMGGKEVTVRFVKECDEAEVYDVRRQMNLELLERLQKLEVL
ncbi:MAG: mechanosensitive ion channel [Oscillospiraceae bacterium]|nr:mechanosensitive ion channel [Oscillospiraceae bacterium]